MSTPTKTAAPVAGTRYDRSTNQYVPTINGVDTSPTSYDEERALQIAREQIARQYYPPETEKQLQEFWDGEILSHEPRPEKWDFFKEDLT